MNLPQILASSLIICATVVQPAPAIAAVRYDAIQESPNTQSSGQLPPPSSSGLGRMQSGTGSTGTTAGSGSSGASGSAADEAAPAYSAPNAVPEVTSTSGSTGSSGTEGQVGSSPREIESTKKMTPTTTDNLLRAQTRALNELSHKIEALETRVNKLEKKRK
jgi:hypothetical protein